jgi:hypothetical protein
MSVRLVQVQLPSSSSNVSDTSVRTLPSRRGKFLAIFHDAIKRFMPQIVELVKDEDRNVRSAGAEIIAEVVEQRK